MALNEERPGKDSSLAGTLNARHEWCALLLPALQHPMPLGKLP